MDYFDYTVSQFKPRVSAALEGMKTNFIAAGITLANATITEVTTGTNHLRYQIVTKKGGKTFTSYIQLTPFGVSNKAMTLIINIVSDGNGVAIPSTFSFGGPVRYDLETGIDTLIAKLSDVEGVCAGELLTAAKTFLGV